MRRDVDTLRWVTVVEARGLLQAVGSPAGAPYSSRHRIARGGLWRGRHPNAPARGPGTGARGDVGRSPQPPPHTAEFPDEPRRPPRADGSPHAAGGALLPGG